MGLEKSLSRRSTHSRTTLTRYDDFSILQGVMLLIFKMVPINTTTQNSRESAECSPGDPSLGLASQSADIPRVPSQAHAGFCGVFTYKAQCGERSAFLEDGNLPTTRRAPIQEPLFRLIIVTITLRLEYCSVHARSRSYPKPL